VLHFASPLVRNDLGYQGYAPVGSRDTQNADQNRAAFVRNEGDAVKALL
jgi:hypothetical protein